METKPFSLQSPEQIAKDYGGNKQKIAEAMQMGIVDPTAGTLAAMFIDRMRGAAQAEAVPQQSVAQQVFAPPQPQMPQGLPQMPVGAPPAPMAPAGLGVTPEAAAMPAPEMAMPGMAMGGMVPPYASGGLTSLSVPDDMFDEPSNGSYANGGLVAFAGGTGKTGVVEEEEKKYIYTGKPGRVDETDTIVVDAPEEQPKLSTQYQQGMMFNTPENILGGLKEKVTNLFDFGQELNPYRTERAQELEAMLEQARSPEERKKRKQEDMWTALGQIGARMASTPGSLLQAASAGIGEALPGIAAAAKERRGEERAITKELLSEERMSNKERTDRFNMTLDLVVKGVIPLEEAYQDRNFRDKWERLGNETQERVARINAAAGITQAGISARASMYGSDRELQARRGAYFDNAYTELKKTAPFDPQYQALAAKNPTAADLYIRRLAEQETNRVYGGGSTGANSGSGSGNDPVGIR
jgi:hypothetical protein